MRDCLRCGTPFQITSYTRDWQLYCSGACRQAAYRNRVALRRRGDVTEGALRRGRDVTEVEA